MTSTTCRIHENIERLLSQEVPFDLDMLDIDEFIDETDSQVWNTICLLMRCISDRRGTSRAADQTSIAYQTKKMRFFLLCALLFCTDDCCLQPGTPYTVDRYSRGSGWISSSDQATKQAGSLCFIGYPKAVYSIQGEQWKDSKIPGSHCLHHCICW